MNDGRDGELNWSARYQLLSEQLRRPNVEPAALRLMMQADASVQANDSRRQARLADGWVSAARRTRRLVRRAL